MGSGVRRFRLGALAVITGLAMAIPGVAAAAPAGPHQDPFGLAVPLKPCHPDTSPPYYPVTLRPAATQTLGFPGYLMPAGMSYFGIGTQVGSPYLKNSLLVGDSSFQCTSDGYDQSLTLNWAQLTSPTDPAAKVFTWFSTKAVKQQFATCEALIDAGETAQFDDYEQVNPICDQLNVRPSHAVDLPVAGTPLSIGYAVYPANQPLMPGPARYPTLEVSIFEYTDPLTGTLPNPPVPITSIQCALPFAQQASCLETLAEWVQTQLTSFYGTTAVQATRANAALRAQIQEDPNPAPLPAGPGGATAATATGCTAPLNEGIESKLAELKPIPLQAAPRKGESGAMAKVAISVAFSPLEFHLCEQGLLGASIDPGTFEIGLPSMTVRDEDQQHNKLGPFVYNAESHGWENSTQIPRGQDLDTHYDASFRVELGPQVSATLDPAKIAAGGAPDIALNLITLVLQARPQEVTLMKSRDGREALQMVDSPQLTFSLEVSPKEVEQQVSDDEAASKEPATELINDASEEIASQDAVAMEDEIEATAGLSGSFPLSTIVAVEGEIRDVVLTAFQDDPALASVEAQAVAEGALIQAEQDDSEAEQQLEQLLESSPEEDVSALLGDLEAAGA